MQAALLQRLSALKLAVLGSLANTAQPPAGVEQPAADASPLYLLRAASQQAWQLLYQLAVAPFSRLPTWPGLPAGLLLWQLPAAALAVCLLPGLLLVRLTTQQQLVLELLLLLHAAQEAPPAVAGCLHLQVQAVATAPQLVQHARRCCRLHRRRPPSVAGPQKWRNKARPHGGGGAWLEAPA